MEFQSKKIRLKNHFQLQRGLKEESSGDDDEGNNVIKRHNKRGYDGDDSGDNDDNVEDDDSSEDIPTINLPKDEIRRYLYLFILNHSPLILVYEYLSRKTKEAINPSRQFHSQQQEICYSTNSLVDRN